MPNRIQELNGHRLLAVEDDGPALARVQDFLDLISDAFSQGATTIAAPVARLDPAFFRLRSGLAGEVAQKIVNYRRRLAVIGDISAFTAASTALADFVRESNRGGNVLFLPDMDALANKLSDLAEPR